MLFPPYAVARHVVVRRHGDGPERIRLRERALAVAAVLVASAYAVLGVAAFRPNVMPAISRFIMRGGLAFLGPLVAVDLVLAAFLSPERTLAARERARAAADGVPPA